MTATLTQPPTNAKTTTCRRVTIKKAGSYDRLELETIPGLQPRAGEVLIDVKATGVNYADCIVRVGLPRPGVRRLADHPRSRWPASSRPWGRGSRTSPSATGFSRHALRRLRQPGAREARQGLRAAGLDLLRAAAGIPAVYLTAYYGLVELARPRKGQKVLIHSAAGGVGGALVQLAKVHGCEVTAVVGATHKVETARRAGADHVIDKSKDDLWSAAEKLAPKGFDIIADANGIGAWAPLRAPAHAREAV